MLRRAERGAVDRLLTAALEDPDCPLFVISTVRSDFLDRFEDLPRLIAVRNRLGKAWTLPVVSMAGLREIIGGSARLAGIDPGDVQEAMIAEARGEPGALPLVENALHWLWEHRSADDRLSGRLFNEWGGLGGILSQSADDLLEGLGEGRDQALELLFRLVKVDPEGRSHTRRRISRAEGVALGGGGNRGGDLVDRLAGARAHTSGSARGPLRLITVGGDGATSAAGSERWIDLIHETLVRTRIDPKGRQRPYWPTLWHYVECHQNRAAWLERVRADTRSWLESGRDHRYLWSHERVREAATALTQVGPAVELREDEWAFLGPIYPEEMIAELKQRETTHDRRALIGERLEVFGDSRAGIGVANDLPQIDWCRIQGGDVTIEIRTDPEDHYSPVNTTLTRTVQAFSIARYPITVAQFRAFLDDCHQDGRWLLPPGFPVNELHTHLPARPRSRHANHPADSVNWLDAMAFCHWLSARLEAEIRLPSEFEWQLAATGGDPANIYPWGSSRDPLNEPWRANTYESGLPQVTAVGCYPGGSSIDGVLDMAGSLWEWCQNEFDNPEATAFHTERRHRVVRGGSWSVNHVLARCTSRVRYNPYGRDSDLGFRVVCSSPIAKR